MATDLLAYPCVQNVGQVFRSRSTIGGPSHMGTSSENRPGCFAAANDVSHGFGSRARRTSSMTL
jgi:hypothetical protein